MDFVYVDDVARANVLAATSSATDEIFNIGTGREVSLAELAEILLVAMGSPQRPVFGPTRAVNVVDRRVADISLARRVLGFEANVTIEEGVGRLVEWWQVARRRLAAAAV
jgi:UDP-glucose 4-epimerase